MKAKIAIGSDSWDNGGGQGQRRTDGEAKRETGGENGKGTRTTEVYRLEQGECVWNGYIEEPIEGRSIGKAK